MKRIFVLFLSLLLSAGCGRQPTQPQGNLPDRPPSAQAKPADNPSLLEGRRGFSTKIVRKKSDRQPPAEPPPNLFRLVRYDSPAGKLAAYVSPAPQDGKKRPAILWITGGDCNSIDEGCWQEQPPQNDQSASAYRKAGLIMMFPSLRGGNDNPGVREGFFGEVEDVIAARDYLAGQDYVDAGRIYLGGHSTGGTLVLLVAAASDRFRAVFSFGPVANLAGYPAEYRPFDTTNAGEFELREPVHWLGAIRSPVFVFEGTERGNLTSLQQLAKTSTNPLAHFHPVKKGDHFSILAPTNRLIADKLLRDTGPATNVSFTEEELNRLLAK